jgi:hypothetical protein
MPRLHEYGSNPRNNDDKNCIRIANVYLFSSEHQQHGYQDDMPLLVLRSRRLERLDLLLLSLGRLVLVFRSRARESFLSRLSFFLFFLLLCVRFLRFLLSRSSSPSSSLATSMSTCCPPCPSVATAALLLLGDLDLDLDLDLLLLYLCSSEAEAERRRRRLYFRRLSSFASPLRGTNSPLVLVLGLRDTEWCA